MSRAGPSLGPTACGRKRRVAPRVPRVTLDEGALQAAAVAFAKGEIDRVELMRRISR